MNRSHPGKHYLELRQALDRAGWRFTRQRAAVFDHLRSVDSHPTAEEIYIAVRRQIPTLSLATVYKAMEALVDCGLVNKLACADGPGRFDCRGEAHYHLRCTRTGQICDMAVPYDEELLAKIDPALVAQLRARGFEVTGHRLEVIGYFREG